MSRKSCFVIVAFACGLSACKVGVPEIETLRKLGGFVLDQTSIAVSNKLNPQFTVSGKCNDDYTDIEVSFDGGSHWTSVQKVASPATVQCSSSQTFSLTFNSVSSYIKSGSTAASGIWMFRGVSDLGNSETLSLNLIVPQKNQLILTGSAVTNVGSLRLTSRVGGNMTTESGSYIFHSTIKAK